MKQRMRWLMATAIVLFAVHTNFANAWAIRSCVKWKPELFQSLNYGIYWLKENGNGDITARKAVANPKDESGYFDPHKKTLIYIHGWSLGQIKAHAREDLCYFDEEENAKYPDEHYDTLQPWLEKGWNVGVLYWNQFSDANVLFAQSKLYTAKYMYWKYTDKKGKTHIHYGTPKPGEDVTQLAYDNYLKVLSATTGQPIRITGHSFGSQLAIQLTTMLYKNYEQGRVDKKFLPRQLVLLDPGFSPLPSTYLPGGKSTSQINDEDIQYLERIDPKLAISEFYSSEVAYPYDRYDRDIINRVAFTQYVPNYLHLDFYTKKYGTLDGYTKWLSAAHRAARYHYFDSAAFGVPKDNQGHAALSANTSLKTLYAAMHDGYLREQTCGTKVFITERDGYSLISPKKLQFPMTLQAKPPSQEQLYAALQKPYAKHMVHISDTHVAGEHCQQVSAHEWLCVQD